MNSVNSSQLVSLIAERLRELGFEVKDPDRGKAPTRDLVAIWPERSQHFSVLVNLRAPHGVPGRGAAATERRILALPHVSPGEGARLRARGVHYVDSGGNAWINAPGLTVWIEGRTPAYKLRAGIERPSRAFRPTGLKIIFALLCAQHLLEAPLREIASATGVSLGAVSNTLTELRESGLLAESRGRRFLTDRQRLTERWVEHYVSTLRPTLSERRVDGPEPHWWMTDEGEDIAHRMHMQLGGESALQHLGLDLRAGETVLYGAPPWQGIVLKLRMPPSAEGRVVLREQFWDAEILGGGPIVPRLLVYADAIASGDERQIDIAKELTREH